MRAVIDGRALCIQYRAKRSEPWRQYKGGAVYCTQRVPRIGYSMRHAGKYQGAGTRYCRAPTSTALFRAPTEGCNECFTTHGFPLLIAPYGR